MSMSAENIEGGEKGDLMEVTALGVSTAEEPPKVAVAVSRLVQRFSIEKIFMRLSCTFVMLVMCVFAGVPIAFFLFPPALRFVSFIHIEVPSTSYEIPKNFRGRNIYVSEGTIILGVWHLVPTNVVDLLNNEEYDAFLADRNYPIIFYFHDSMHSRQNNKTSKLQKLLELDKQVITFDYRGLGDSAGFMTGRSLTEDALTVFKTLIQRYRQGNTVYFYGHHVGNSVAAEALQLLEDQGYAVAGIILDSPIYSAYENAKSTVIYKVFFSYLPQIIAEKAIEEPLKDYNMDFPTFEHSDEITKPILVITAEDDQRAPVHLTQQLRDHVRGENESNLLFYVEFRRCFEYGKKGLHMAREYPDLLRNYFDVTIRLKDDEQSERRHDPSISSTLGSRTGLTSVSPGPGQVPAGIHIPTGISPGPPVDGAASASPDPPLVSASRPHNH